MTLVAKHPSIQNPLVPAKAGTQCFPSSLLPDEGWIPACAGMSGSWEVGGLR